jgi:hypothetical protein
MDYKRPAFKTIDIAKIDFEKVATRWVLDSTEAEFLGYLPTFGGGIFFSLQPLVVGDVFSDLKISCEFRVRMGEEILRGPKPHFYRYWVEEI